MQTPPCNVYASPSLLPCDNRASFPYTPSRWPTHTILDQTTCPHVHLMSRPPEVAAVQNTSREVNHWTLLCTVEPRNPWILSNPHQLSPTEASNSILMTGTPTFHQFMGATNYLKQCRYPLERHQFSHHYIHLQWPPSILPNSNISNMPLTTILFPTLTENDI